MTSQNSENRAMLRRQLARLISYRGRAKVREILGVDDGMLTSLLDGSLDWPADARERFDRAWELMVSLGAPEEVNKEANKEVNKEMNEEMRRQENRPADDRHLFLAAQDQESYGTTYVASPYGHSDRVVLKARVRAAQTVAADMVRNGIAAFSPVHYTHALLEATGAAPPDGWYAFDLHFLEHAAKMVILELPGWEESRGIMIEKAFAHGRRIPVQHMGFPEIIRMLDVETRIVLEQDARDREWEGRK